jgi:hypothetical protein
MIHGGLPIIKLNKLSGNFATRHSSMSVFADGHHPMLSLLVGMIQLCLFVVGHQVY